jgi:N-methylhydantoinase A
VSDANLVLGILNPDYFLGGSKKLNVEIAKQAIKTKIADPLGMSVEDAAAAVFEIQNAQTADLVRTVVVGAGHDPRDFVMYAFGGAGPVHCAAYGADLGVKEVLVPLGQTAAVFSAYGLATSDVVLSAELSDPANFPVEPETMERNLAQLEEEVGRGGAAQNVDFKSVSLVREADIRYTMQIFEVSTPVPPGRIDEGAAQIIADNFEERYASLYGAGTGFREAGLQIITYRVFGTGTLPFKAELPILESKGGPKKPVAKQTRRAMLDGRSGWMDVSVFDYSVLGAGSSLTGPAIVEAPTTTVVIPPNTSAVVDDLGNLIIRYR